MATQPKRIQETETETETPNFSSLLDTPSEDVERPKPGPMGHYLSMVKGHITPGKIEKTQTETMVVTFQLLEAGDDVDADDLENWLTRPNGEVVPLRDRTIQRTYFITEKALFMFKDFLTDLGIPERDEKGNKLTLAQRAQEAPGRTCYIHVTHNPSTRDGTTMFANVDRTLPVKE